MGRNPLMGRRRTLTCFTVAFLFFIAPDLFRLHPYTAPLADVVSWLGDKAMQGLASTMFFLAICAACSLVHDAYRWLTGHSDSAAQPTPDLVPAPTPAELEGGGATPAYDLAVLEVEVGSTPASAQPSSMSTSTFSATAQATTGGKVLMLFITAVLFGWQFSTSGVMSLEHPPLENVSAAVLYVLRGWEVVFVFGLLVMGVAWWKRQRQAEADTAPAEVLFEGTLANEEQFETPVKKEDEFSEKS